ncbi:MAG: MoxR family ATPase [Gammaproteobacteria bacterium]|nr:MoxR family ATPase [Gammaproteobacteria bacterium]
MSTEKNLPKQTGNTGSLQSLFAGVRTGLGNRILGQQHLVDRLVIALLSDGHLLVEGAPGLAKTRAIKSLAELIDSQFHRVQFTPDLLPSDLTGTDVYQPQQGTFQFQKGPLFHNIILADEINRAPAKVQSALLEAMAERQITIGRTTHGLPELFMVMATQNPIEQEGTYPLPEAQLDRFLMHTQIGYPAIEVESRIMELARSEALQQLDRDLSGKNPGTACIGASQIHEARTEILNLYLSGSMQEYIVQLVLASRNPGGYDETLGKWIDYGASPRGSIGLERVARAHAWLSGRDFVSPDDVQAMVHDVLRHRIILSFSAEAEGISTDRVIDRLLELVPVP